MDPNKAFTFTAEEAEAANASGKPIMMEAGAVEEMLRRHGDPERHDLDVMAPANEEDERDAWLVLKWLGY